MEKEIKLVCGETIDEVVDMLLNEKKKGKEVYCDFNDTILHSKDMSSDREEAINNAYIAITGYTRKEYYEKHFGKHESIKPKKTSREIVEEAFAPTAENSVSSMKLAKFMSLTKDGKYWSFVAEQYIENMSKYSIYCKEERQEEWTNTIESLIYLSGTVDDEYILRELRSKEYTGIIMEALANGKKMEEVKKIVNDQGHSGFSISLLGQNMLDFSPYGLEFASKVIGRYATNSDTNLCKAYRKELKRRKQNIK